MVYPGIFNGNWRAFDGQAAGRQGVPPPALGDFCSFSTKLTRFNTHFGQNSFFKAISYQLKAFKKQSKHTKYDK